MTEKVFKVRYKLSNNSPITIKYDLKKIETENFYSKINEELMKKGYTRNIDMI